MDKKIATPKSSQAQANYTTTAEQVYNLLRSGSLVTVDHPADLIPIGRFLSFYESGIDDGRLNESLVSVRDLLTLGRVRVRGWYE